MSFVDTVLTLLLNFQKLESWLSNQFFNVYPCHHDLKFVVISALQSGVKLHHYLTLKRKPKAWHFWGTQEIIGCNHKQTEQSEGQS